MKTIAQLLGHIEAEPEAALQVEPGVGVKKQAWAEADALCPGEASVYVTSLWCHSRQAVASLGEHSQSSACIPSLSREMLWTVAFLAHHV